MCWQGLRGVLVEGSEEGLGILVEGSEEGLGGRGGGE